MRKKGGFRILELPRCYKNWKSHLGRAIKQFIFFKVVPQNNGPNSPC